MEKNSEYSVAFSFLFDTNPSKKNNEQRRLQHLEAALDEPVLDLARGVDRQRRTPHELGGEVEAALVAQARQRVDQVRAELHDVAQRQQPVLRAAQVRNPLDVLGTRPGAAE